MISAHISMHLKEKPDQQKKKLKNNFKYPNYYFITFNQLETEKKLLLWIFVENSRAIPILCLFLIQFKINK